MAAHPACVLVFSGKRKSGKDYVTERLRERLGSKVCSILRLSGPLKGQYAMEHGLDINRLLDATEYKEKYRADMIRWGEEKRNKEPSYFCKLATSGPEASKPIWIISDARRKTDIVYFKQNYRFITYTVRVQASEETRKKRGWVFTKGIDDAESECDLDSVKMDLVVDNDGDNDTLQSFVNDMMVILREKMVTVTV